MEIAFSVLASVAADETQDVTARQSAAREILAYDLQTFQAKQYAATQAANNASAEYIARQKASTTETLAEQTEDTADRDRRFRYVALLAAFVFAVLALFTCSCASPKVTEFPRDAKAIADTALRLEVTCTDVDPFNALTASVDGQLGSATLLSSTTAITAAHVLTCAAGDPLIRAVSLDGTKVPVTIKHYARGRDLAVIQRIDGGAWRTNPATIGPPPNKGEAVCFGSGAP
jgi:V8-like Glu-specific endopeptidase